MYKRYLITGATGFLGSVLVSALLEKKKNVFALHLPGDLRVNRLPP